MKLRLLNNSIRIRFQQKELEALHREGIIESTTRLGPTDDQQFRYVLRKDIGAKPLDAALENNCLTIGIAPSAIDALINTDLVGVSTNHEPAAGEMLYILVEKDFKCLTPRAGEEDAFPHPDESAGHSC